MGQTIAEKILSNHSGKKTYGKDIVIADIDYAMSQDGTTPLAIEAFKNMQIEGVWDPNKISFVIDHSAPSPIKQVSNLHEMMREFASEHKLNVYDIGCGVCHQLMPEGGHVVPGDLVVGADSHTCTYGALNAFSTGIGSTDIAAVYASGKLWFKVPESLKINIEGPMPPGVYSKDLILKIIGDLTADGATYKSVEFVGETINFLSVDARMTISNMAVEMGAKAGIMQADSKVLDYLQKHSQKKPKPVKADADASYSDIINLDARNLEPMVAKPHRVDNVVSLSEIEGQQIGEAYLGTCTNGRLEDLRIASEILEGKKISDEVRFIVAPASKQVYLDAIKEGIMQIIISSGAAIVTPGCGPCVGTHNGVPADEVNVISTANRNFKGRMGNPDAFIYLASPATVAASAIEGKITDPRKYLKIR